MDSYLKQQEVEGSIQEINLATAAADKATAALVGSKSPNVAENTMTTTAVPTVPKLTLKRKAPGTDSATANPLNSDAEVRKVLSSYGAVQSHSNANSMGSNTGLSPAAKRRRSGRTSGSNTTVCKIKVSTQKTNIKVALQRSLQFHVFILLFHFRTVKMTVIVGFVTKKARSFVVKHVPEYSI